MISIAIIDIIGLTYDGDTLNKRGLGGSESAVILISKELAKQGFDVTVFNNCIDKEAKEGVYDNVKYIDHTRLDFPNDFKFDVVISSRTVIPFLPPHLYNQFTELKPQRYSKIKQHAKLKAMWMHDTFSRGDHLLEDMLLNKDFDEIFTLSDFQTSYVTNCDHGKKRMFEVLKNHIFITRNGIIRYKDEVDITKKDPHLYVYNASVTKGMIPLVERIWERVKQNIPQAKLKVIGGYYRFRENSAPDVQEQKWRQLVADEKYKKLDVEFTGIIKQSEIAEIMAQASFMLYPASFPETFGISTLESLAYNTPLITNRFGALEETAIEQACYMLDYPIEPNGLFPWIIKEEQERKFIDIVLKANADRYLHQQKMYYCNIIKDIVGWDSVALQWKQHIYKKINEYLPLADYKKVSHINNRIHQVFGRRFFNKEENYLPRTPQQKIIVVTPMYNAENYIEKCIKSVITQDYDNYLMVIIDDGSIDNSYEIAKRYESDKIKVIKNIKNKGAVRNQIETIIEYREKNDIIMFLDGDDSLVNDNQIFHFYNNLYDGTTEFTYGSCWSMVDRIPLISQPYPNEIKQEKKYRSHKFNWNMPYTHLRTFKAFLLDSVDDNKFKDEQGNWYKAGGDGSIFYTLIEKADPNKIKVVQDIVYNYNDMSPLNDYKVNASEQTKNANRILTQ
jgi:glycosyltransferase involved in cell wall biosynthesis